jgi:hypothetical protein
MEGHCINGCTGYFSKFLLQYDLDIRILRARGCQNPVTQPAYALRRPFVASFCVCNVCKTDSKEQVRTRAFALTRELFGVFRARVKSISQTLHRC